MPPYHKTSDLPPTSNWSEKNRIMCFSFPFSSFFFFKGLPV
jgi:hypothetical protein